ncbi:Polycomb complex protein BMI-1 [Frankliniella fusca]|uniref:Polycomb complex protein BMI-1 n=1 Tax=Frankliniella fusca TaxID=407009 RepID=A0AAE1LBQ0_9NEOP|nr:Polycomb complex protein BMI-1 [Frankliniella fusca]
MTPKKVELKELNALITCSICKGYFVDATTVTECLHTFCRSCIVKHFKRSLFCPECEVQVEKGCPLNKLRPDPRKQLLVYKMVPRLHANEMTRQQLFLKKYAAANPLNQNGVTSSTQRPLLPENLSHAETVRDRIVDKIHLYSPEEKLSLSVEYESGLSNTTSMNQDLGIDKQVNPHKRYLQCPAAFTIYHLKKFIRLKYDIGAKQTITIFYEGEQVSENSSLMDVAYQFFYDAKSPMRFTYRVTPGYVVKPAPTELTKPTPAPSKPPTLVPTVLVKPLSLASLTPSVTRQLSRGSTSSSDESGSSTTTRRQQRQRSAKTAAYTAIEAMDESDREEEPPVKRRRTPGKSPRWESDRDSPEPYTVYRNTRRTPKTSLEDFEARYNVKPSGKRVYAICSDDEVSDPETKRNTIANRNSSSRYANLMNLLKSEKDANRPRFAPSGKKSRKKKVEEDVYEFNAQNEDNDSNTTQEFDFVYDNSDYESAESEKIRKEPESERLNENGCAAEDSADMHEVEADEHELEEQIEMEVVTDTEDIERHIEDSIEEVEVDVDDDSQHDGGHGVGDDNDNQLEAETTSSSCLVIAEDEDDDGVVEEVIAAEEDGHELVVVEDPEETDVTYTVQVYNVGSTDNSDKVSEESSSSPRHSASSRSPTVEEDEPEIVHEKVNRKKSKKSKHHHHHHHHHKRKRHHSPVMLVSNSEDAPMKLTLKLRPTPSISPGSSKSSKSHADSTNKEKRVSICLSPSREMTGRESPSQKIYTVKITSPKPVAEDKPPSDATKDHTSHQVPSVTSPTPKPESEKTEMSNLTSLEPKADVSAEKALASVDHSSEKTSDKRQVHLQSLSVSCTPASPPPSPSPSKTSCVPDLKSVKTPSSLTISKVEAGETPPRTEEPSNKPALEILVLPPSPPPSDKQSDDSEECSTSSDPLPKKKESSSASVKRSQAKDVRPGAILPDSRENSLEQACVLDLSDRAKRESLPLPPPPAAPAISPISSYMAPRPPPPPVQFILHPPGAQPEASLSSTQLRNLHNMIDEATIATVNRMNSMLATGQPVIPNLPMFPQVYHNAVSNAVNAQRRLLPTPSLGSVIGGRRGSGYGVGPSGAGASRPNQSVRHIPNPSALSLRQPSSGHGKLTEQELKERLQQFQQNRAAKAAFTYSRASNAPARSGVVGPNASGNNPITGSSAGLSAVGGSSVGNGLGTAPPTVSSNNLSKNAIRPRSIETVAGLLSVRAGVTM